MLIPFVSPSCASACVTGARALLLIEIFGTEATSKLPFAIEANVEMDVDDLELKAQGYTRVMPRRSRSNRRTDPVLMKILTGFRPFH